MGRVDLGRVACLGLGFSCIGLPACLPWVGLGELAGIVVVLCCQAAEPAGRRQAQHQQHCYPHLPCLPRLPHHTRALTAPTPAPAPPIRHPLQSTIDPFDLLTDDESFNIVPVGICADLGHRDSQYSAMDKCLANDLAHQPCPANTYTIYETPDKYFYNEKETTFKVCGLCPGGTQGTVNATASYGCTTCPAGYSSTIGGSCTVCPPGTYSNAGGWAGWAGLGGLDGRAV